MSKQKKKYTPTTTPSLTPGKGTPETVTPYDPDKQKRGKRKRIKKGKKND